jgi:hypothetical protein
MIAVILCGTKLAIELYSEAYLKTLSFMFVKDTHEYRTLSLSVFLERPTNTKTLRLGLLGPIAHSNGHDPPGLIALLRFR